MKVFTIHFKNPIIFLMEDLTVETNLENSESDKGGSDNGNGGTNNPSDINKNSVLDNNSNLQSQLSKIDETKKPLPSRLTNFKYRTPD